MRNGKEAMTAVMATTKDLIGSCVNSGSECTLAIF